MFLDPKLKDQFGVAFLYQLAERPDPILRRYWPR